MKFLIYLAILPSIIIGFLIYRSDKREREPIGQLLKSFFFGILSAILVIFLTSILGISRLDVTQMSTYFEMFLYAFFCVALIEEGCKFLFSSLFLKNNEHFDYFFDGVVYSTFVSLGFATLENIIYAIVGGIEAVIVRAIFTVPAHAFFGIAMGINLSLAKEAKLKNNQQSFFSSLFFSLFIPTLLHGLFDFFLFTQDTIFIIIFFLFVIMLYSYFIIKIKKLIATEHAFLQKKYCSECGNKISGNYCSFCGKKIEK